MPKRILRESEVAWQPLAQPKRLPGKGYRSNNARIIRVRLLAMSSRDSFLLVGTANGSFSFTLKWQDYDLARIDCGRRHHLPKVQGKPDEYVHGPHVHYFVAGHGLDFAGETSGYSFSDVNGALAFFMRHCGITNIPPIQEAFRLL